MDNWLILLFVSAIITTGYAQHDPMKLYGYHTDVPIGQAMIKHNNEWRYICNDGGTANVATVICRQLGHSHGKTWTANNLRVGLNWVPYNSYWLDDTNCAGTENYLDECAHAGWGVHDCGDDNEELIVYCGNCTSCPSDKYCWGIYGCHCRLGRMGADCSLAITSQIDCGAHGTYEDMRGKGGTCTCERGWTGPQCTIKKVSLDLDGLRAKVNALPQPVCYYPLSEQFGLNDASGHERHGSYSSNKVLPVRGPFGVAGSAIETGPTLSDDRYMIISGNYLDFQTPASSFSFTFYVNTRHKILPLLDSPGNAYLWTWDTADKLYVSPVPTVELYAPCVFSDSYHFVAVVYDHTTTTLKMFCDSSTTWTSHSTSMPLFTTTIYVGFRTGEGYSTNTQFACIGIYDTALSESQVDDVRNLCPDFQAINCPTQCMPDKCVPDLTQPNGYVCEKCNSRYAGPECKLSLVGLRETVAALPQPVVYLPLSKQFELNDGSGHQRNAYYSANKVIPAVGPFGESNTAYETGPTVSDNRYINISGSYINFGNSSFTFTFFVNMKARRGLMLDYYDGGPKATLWAWDTANILHFNPLSPSANLNVPCLMPDGFHFVSVVYDHSEGTVKIYCEATSEWTSFPSTPPTTLDSLLVGFRPGSSEAKDFQFACIGIYHTALSMAEVAQVESLCPAFQAIKCQAGCTPGTCYPDLESHDGYACTSCKPGFSGPQCTPNLEALRTLYNALPQPAVYLPLSEQFQLNDGSGHQRHAYYSANKVIPVVGPFGEPNTAYETGPTVSDNRYINITGSYINFGNSSFTFTLFVNMKAREGPMLEYYDGAPKAMLWSWNNGDTLYFNSKSTAVNDPLNAPCVMPDGFHFVSVIYDHSGGTLKIYCEVTSDWTTFSPAPPATLDSLLVGFRPGLADSEDFQFACIGIYNTALTEAEVAQVANLCPAFQAITCSAGCAPGTCYPDLEASRGFGCTNCLPGYGGPQCGDLQDLRDIFTALPQPAAYYPMTAQFRLNDGSGHQRHASFSANEVIPVIGPFNVANTGYETGPTHGDNRYIYINGSFVNFGASSWTVALFVNMKGKVGPMVEYFNNKAHFWVFDTPDKLMMASVNGADHLVNCTRPVGYNFFSGIYDHSSSTLRQFCDSSSTWEEKNSFPVPLTTDILQIGYRDSGAYSDQSTDFQFACLGLYSTALTETQVDQVRQLCPLFQQVIDCPAVGCTPGTCYPSVNTAKGYSCTSCEPGFTGTKCKPDLNELRTLVAALPPPVAYFPFTKQFGLKDGSGNGRHAIYSTNKVIPVIGPFGDENTAFETGPTVDDNRYINITGSYVNFGASSYTFTFFANMKENVGPMLEYQSNSHFWIFDTKDEFLFNSVAAYTEMPCSMPSGFHFVSLKYHHDLGTVEVFCDDTSEWTSISTTVPSTVDTLLVGFRPGSQYAKDFQFACLGIYATALTDEQVVQVRQLCPLFQKAIKCPEVGCEPDSCYPNITATKGYSCSSCESGFSGPECTADTPLVELKARVARLPTPEAYYPLSEKFGLNDGSGNKRHAVFSENKVTLATGPFNVANTAYETGPTAAENRYINISTPAVNFGSTSWTITVFVNTKAQTGPLWEYYNDRSFFWAINDSTKFHYHPRSDGDSSYFISDCAMISGFSFMSIMYDHASSKVKVFCDSKSEWFQFTSQVPVTGNTLLLGYRPVGSEAADSNDFQFACLGIYNTALSFDQVEHVRKLCPLFNEAITCPSSCVPGSCYPDLQSDEGFACRSCENGYSGPQCKTTLQYLEELVSALPQPVAYYPLTAGTGLRDASGHRRDAHFSANEVIPVAGPFGVANTAFETGPTLGDNRYINITGSYVNFGASSYTFTFFANMKEQVGPMLEYLSSSHIWAYNTQDKIAFNSVSGNSQIPCYMSSGFHFVSVKYRNDLGTTELFCEHTSKWTSFSIPVPVTKDTLLVGFRPGDSRSRDLQFACLGIYNTALTDAQVDQVRQLCPLYQQALSCPVVGCIAGSCSLDLTSPPGYSCDSCEEGFSGPQCTPTSPLVELKARVAALPTPVVYFPLAQKFGLNDASGNGRHAAFSANKVTPVTGPFNETNTAYETGPNVNDNQYIIINGSYINFGASSYTFTFFANMKARIGPMFEYISYQFHVWAWNNKDTIFINPNSPSADNFLPCSMSTGFHFVSLKYHHDLATIKVFCEDTGEWTSFSTTVPATTNTLHVGFRSGDANSKDVQHACLGIYDTALTELQVDHVRQLCPLFNSAISCGVGCVPEKCFPDLTKADGYSCTECLVGHSLSDCRLGNCHDLCINGVCDSNGRMCLCFGGWTGPACDTALDTTLLNDLKTQVAALPSPVVYYPFNENFRLNDGSGNKRHAYFSANEVTLAKGPFGVPNTAYENGATVSENKFINITTPAVNFGASSWTMTFFVDSNGHDGPLWERPGIFNLWSYPSLSKLHFNAGPIMDLGCPIPAGFMFVAVVYDHANTEVRILCDSTSTWGTVTGTPSTTSNTLINWRAGEGQSKNDKHACFSLYAEALSEAQVDQVRNLCSLFTEAITCPSVGCTPGSCYPDLTSPYGYACESCENGFSGSNCLPTSLGKLIYLTESLPPPVAYYPLSEKFNLNDGSGNKRHAYFSANPATSVTGPFGVANTAYENGATHAQSQYINVTGSYVNFGPSSWTITVFANMKENRGPIFEYNMDAYLWVYDTTNKLLFKGSVGSLSVSCALSSGFHYFSVIYDHSSSTVKVFCDSSSTWTEQTGVSFLATEDTLKLGFRTTGCCLEDVKDSQFACLGIYSEALTEVQAESVRALCPLYNAVIDCPSTCLPGSCYPDLAMPNGFACHSCLHGYIPPECKTPLNDLKSRVAALPSAVAYYPLSKQFELNDGSGNQRHALYSTNKVTPVIGPNGINGTAFEIGDAIADDKYFSISGSFVDFGSSSWTIVVFVNTKERRTPVLEFNNGATRSSHFWMGHPSADKLYWSTDSDYFDMACDQTGFQFVGVVYDHTSSDIKLYCDGTFSNAQILSGPPTTETLLVAGSRHDGVAQGSQFACLGLYTEALTLYQLEKVRELCPLYNEVISCPVLGCTPGTCIPDLTNSKGFICSSCEAGFEGPYCLPTSALGQLKVVLAELPSPVAYYPLSEKFGVNDGSGNLRHASFSANKVVPVQGPFGVANTAFELGETVADTQYINITGSYVDFGSSSWTMAFFVNSKDRRAPLLEFTAGGNRQTYIYMGFPSLDKLYIGTDGGHDMACDQTGFQYVAIVYDHTAGELKLYCDGVFSDAIAIGSAPSTTSLLVSGSLEDSSTQGSQLACLALYQEALSLEQLSKVRQLCSLYDQAITCSEGCVTDSCYPDMAGLQWFSCTSCLSGYVDADCKSPLENLKRRVADLPTPIVYYPLSEKFKLNDGSGHKRHAHFSQNEVIPVTGPFGVANTGYEGGPNQYINITGSFLNVGASSWSWAFFVNPKGMDGPLWEYINGFHIWSYSSGSELHVNNGIVHNYACTILNTWMFVSVVYDHDNTELKVFCDSSSTWQTVSGTPNTADTLLSVRLDTQLDFQRACFSMYPVALSESQVQEVRELCPLFTQAITCSDGCTPGTCFPDLTQPDGFACTSCIPGYGGEVCKLLPECNNGVLDADAKCNCFSGWSGVACDIAVNITLLEELRALVADVPAPAAYYPLTEQFRLNDGSGFKRHAFFSANEVTPVKGPFGIANTAYENGPTASDNRYINITGSFVNFGSSSFTFTFFVNMKANVGMMLEYYSEKAQLWAYDTSNKLYFNPVSPHAPKLLDCNMPDGFHFVSVVYDHAEGNVKLFCEATSAWTSFPTTVPATTETLLAGFRPGHVDSKDFQLACIGIYNTALTEAQVERVRQMCPLFQKAIQCPTIGCTPGNCYPDLPSPYGFACDKCEPGYSGRYCTPMKCPNCVHGECLLGKCVCNPGWGGEDCAESILANLRGRVAALPPAVVYYPLTKQFQLNDGSGNQRHARFTAKKVIPITGPFGIPDTAYETGPTSSDNQYIDIPGSFMDLGSYSWTFTYFMDTTVDGTSWEFTKPPGYTRGSHTTWKSSGTVIRYTRRPSYFIDYSCTRTNGFMFYAFVYDYPNSRMKIFCDSNSKWSDTTSISVPVGINPLFLSNLKTSRFACVSFYKEALTPAQVNQVRELCPLFTEAITCPTDHCVEGTCYPDLANTNGYSCSSCKTGFSGSDCQTPICPDGCVNGNCNAPFQCTCHAGWTGNNCTTPICSRDCGVEGKCTGPNTCSCNVGWTSTRCEIPICVNPCMNNGICTAPDTCTCPSGYAGLQCQNVPDRLMKLASEYKLTGATVLDTVSAFVSSQCGNKCFRFSGCKAANWNKNNKECQLLDKDFSDTGTTLECDSASVFWSVNSQALPSYIPNRSMSCSLMNGECAKTGKSCRSTCFSNRWTGSCF